MPSIKNLFNNNYSSKLEASASLNSAGREVESADFLNRSVQDDNTFIPYVDFTTASNFARYGSLEKYYEDAYTYVYSEYPYDGSRKEKLEWEMSGTYFDRYVFDKVYPRTTGYVNIGYDYGSVTPSDGTFSTPGNLEYIYFKGGPNRAPTLPENTLKQQFTSSNVYKASTRQEYNIDLNGDQGFSVEFWLKKDGWSSSNESRLQVITDLWNSGSYTVNQEGRLLLYLNRTQSDRFQVKIVSGTVSNSFTLGSELNITGNTWNHYAFTFKNDGSSLVSKLYQDGQLKATNTSSDSIGKITGSMVGQIGSIITDNGSSEVQGDGKLSGSIDEYRLWKVDRQPEQVAKNWFTQVYGGTNTDYNSEGTGSAKYSPGNPVDLGVYFKFNEGIVNTGSVNGNDQTVLDYSGRLSNGFWTGYSIGARQTGSAIIESSASATEFKDPILYESHPLVSGTLNDLKVSGSNYDATNGQSIFKSLPSWIQEDDLKNDRNTLSKLTQIIGSYFDVLNMQIDAVPNLKDANYVSASNRPLPFTNKLVESLGFEMPDLFSEAKMLEMHGDRDDFRIYEQKLNDVKNRIYQNIYNNLPYILKSKGAEKSFRNLIRCYGIDESLLKLNLYGNNVTHLIRDNIENVSIKKKYVNFNTGSNVSSNVYQQSSSTDATNTRSYLSCSSELEFKGNTYQSEFIFPKLAEVGTERYNLTNFPTSSLFGCHTTANDDPDVIMYAADDVAGLDVQLVRLENKNGSLSNSGYFRVTGTLIPEVTSSVFSTLYTNDRWNISFRIKPQTYPFAGSLSGTLTPSYNVYFSGYNAISDTIVNQFSVTSSINHFSGQTFLTSSKRFYLGAERQDFTGSVQASSSAKATSLRLWMTHLDDNTLKAHAKDPTNYGVKSLMSNAYTTNSGSTYAQNTAIVPEIDTLALHWNFDNVTGSDSSGEFFVDDFSSGSLSDTKNFSWLGPIAKYQHTGLGDNFPSSTTGAISNDFVLAAQQQQPEVLNSSDMVDIISSNDDSLFTRETRPISYFFSVEKSPYAITTDEIIKLFATVIDFNNLIGEPVNRYRMDYKQLEKARERFFEKVQNTSIDFEKFVDFYKWIDASISVAISQLFPASSDYAERLRTVVESHALERNKYWSKFPTLKEKESINMAVNNASNPKNPNGTLTTSKTISGPGAAQGSKRLTSWKYAHAPVDGDEKKNTKWWKKRAERTNETISSGNSTVDEERQTYEDSSRRDPNPPTPTRTKSDGSTYRNETYQFGDTSVVESVVEEEKKISGGSNPSESTNPEFVKSFISDNDTTKTLSISGDNLTDPKVGNTDEEKPNEKVKYEGTLDDDADPTAFTSMAITKAAPFDLFKKDVNTGYSKQLSDNFKSDVGLENYHNDFTEAEIPMQSPFTERWVGGNQYRHAELNREDSDGNLNDQNSRPEAWQIDLASSKLTIKPRQLQLPRAVYFRETVAKRPVNIKNISYGTSSANIGNFSKNYEVLQLNGRTANNRFFLKAGDEGFKPQTVTSSFITNTAEYALPRFDQTGSNQTIFVNRFSAPGGPDVSALGVLNYESQEFAANNMLNFRNSIVREAVNTFATEHSERFGIKSGSAVRADDYNTSASYYKINRNPKKFAALTDGFNGNVTHSINYDNFWIQHAIPRSAYQYSWITASVSKSSDNDTFGYVSNFSVPSGTTSTTQSALPFLSSSLTGAFVTNGDLIYSDFAGLNTLIYDPVNPNTRLLSSSDGNYKNTAIAELSDGLELNSLLLHRNGPGQYPSWKQVRVGQTQIARAQKDQNILSVFEDGGYFERTETADNTSKFKKKNSFLSKTNATIDKQCVTASLVEPLVTFKYKPLTSVIVHQESLGKQVTLEHCYANNLATFANKEFDEIIPYNVNGPQPYDKLYNLYAGPNPEASLVKMNYPEVVFPKEINTGLAKVRGRLFYAEDSESTGSNGIDRTLLERRTFWRDKLTDRLRLTSSLRGTDGEPFPLNSMGMKDDGGINVWPLDNRATASFGAFGSCADYNTTAISPDDYNGRNVFGGELVRYVNHSESSNNKYHPIAAPMFFEPGETPPITQWNGLHVTASQIYHWEAAMADLPIEDPPQWNTNTISGINPWYDSYEEFSKDIRYMAKDYAILPEFTISDHINYYVGQHGGDFRIDNKKFLSLKGANITSSADTETSPFSGEFFKTYSNSDFQKHFGKFSQDSELNSISIKCDVVKKLLPYNGFYPVLRCAQMGALLSQSVAPYIGGVQWNYGQSLDTTKAAVPSGSLAVQSLMQPFFAPGIMYNTIKSGIAVDYPIFTGSLDDEDSIPFQFFGSGSTISRDLNYRLPFESLVNFKDHIPISASFENTENRNKIMLLNSQRYAGVTGDRDLPYFDWRGDIDPNFEMSTNNFLAETADFFLQDGKFSTIASSPQKDFKAFEAGKTYYMNVYLEMPSEIAPANRIKEGTSIIPTNTNRTVMFEGYYNYSNGFETAGGSSRPDKRTHTARGRWFGPPTKHTGTVAITTDGDLLVSDPAYAPYTPPYYYGKSVATIAYTATGQEATSSNILETIFSNATINYDNPDLFAFSASVPNDGQETSSLAYKHAMMLSSSINLLGKSRNKKVEFDLGKEQDNNFIPTKATDPDGVSMDNWVISPKYETPVLNFANTRCNAGESGDSKTPEGMWATYGNLCKDGQGLWFGVEESHPDLPEGDGSGVQGTSDLTGSLLKVCGFDKSNTRQRIGKVAKSKTISEAIVAIPYVENATRGKKTDFANTVYKPIMCKNFFSLFGKGKTDSRKLFNKVKNNVKNNKPPLFEMGFSNASDIEKTSISDMVNKMDKYVIPPEMNFLLYEDIEPFVMYIMEVEHTLDQQDLADIWQGVMPKIARTAQKDSTEISHKIAPWEFFGGYKVPEEVKWMVFKVKRKAATNYFAKTADSTDDDRFKFDFKVGRKAPDYSYNWPYDFFSLCELAKIEVETEFKTKRDVTPPSEVEDAADESGKDNRQKFNESTSKNTFEES